jgi:hypothetical protein
MVGYYVQKNGWILRTVQYQMNAVPRITSTVLHAVLDQVAAAVSTGLFD